MKKLLALLLALVMIFALAACGGNSNDDDDDKPSKKKGLEDKWSWVMSMEDEMTESGTYTAEDGKLTMTNEDGDEEVYSYEIKGDKMTLIPEGEEGQDMLEALNLDAMELKRK